MRFRGLGFVPCCVTCTYRLAVLLVCAGVVLPAWGRGRLFLLGGVGDIKLQARMRDYCRQRRRTNCKHSCAISGPPGWDDDDVAKHFLALTNLRRRPVSRHPSVRFTLTGTPRAAVRATSRSAVVWTTASPGPLLDYTWLLVARPKGGGGRGVYAYSRLIWPGKGLDQYVSAGRAQAFVLAFLAQILHTRCARVQFLRNSRSL